MILMCGLSGLCPFLSVLFLIKRIQFLLIIFIIYKPCPVCPFFFGKEINRK
jgi:hypothetical protein